MRLPRRGRLGGGGGPAPMGAAALFPVGGRGTGTVPAAATEPAGEASAASALVPVIVEGAPDAAAAAVERFGGVVDTRLSVVDGLSARVPASAVAVLAAVEGVRSVTPDSSVQV